jgi:hypothetical protein
MKKMTLVMAVALILVLSGFALARAGAPSTTKIYSAGYSNLYEISLPQSADGLFGLSTDGSFSCEGSQVKQRETRYYYPKSVVGLTKWNVGQISLSGSIEENNFLQDNLTGFLGFDPGSGVIYIFIGSQYCQEKNETVCDIDGCKCIVTPGLVCSQVYASEIAGKKVILRVPVDK